MGREGERLGLEQSQEIEGEKEKCCVCQVKATAFERSVRW